jgi:Cu(I)/Ag(I) efflux system membrane protein CusA/SilA
MNVFKKNKNYQKIPEAERMAIIERSCKQVSRGVFFSTIIIVASFLPVFLLTGQEGKLFHPLAYTKTFILIVDALLVLTLAPVLISFFMKGRFRPESANPVNRFLERIYEPVIRSCIKWRKTTIGINIIALLISIPLLLSMGREFMPALDEGSLLFMPVTLPDVSNAEVKRLLQVQDKIIKSVPEVDHVLGKAGRANSAGNNQRLDTAYNKPDQYAYHRNSDRCWSKTVWSEPGFNLFICTANPDCITWNSRGEGFIR